ERGALAENRRVFPKTGGCRVLAFAHTREDAEVFFGVRSSRSRVASGLLCKHRFAANAAPSMQRNFPVTHTRTWLSSTVISSAMMLGLAFAAGGCSSETAQSNLPGSENAGELSLDLQVGSGATINSVSYTITGPSGFTKTGTIDVSHSSTVAGLIG